MFQPDGRGALQQIGVVVAQRVVQLRMIRMGRRFLRTGEIQRRTGNIQHAPGQVFLVIPAGLPGGNLQPVAGAGMGKITTQIPIGMVGQAYRGRRIRFHPVADGQLGRPGQGVPHPKGPVSRIAVQPVRQIQPVGYLIRPGMHRLPDLAGKTAGPSVQMVAPLVLGKLKRSVRNLQPPVLHTACNRAQRGARMGAAADTGIRRG